MEDLQPAPIVFLSAENPLTLDLYVYMPLNKQVVLLKKKGEMLSIQETLSLTKADATSKPMIRKDAHEEGMKAIFSNMAAEEISQHGQVGPGVTKVAGAMMKSLAGTEALPHDQAVAAARGIFDDASKLISGLIENYKDVQTRNLFQSFLDKMDKSGDPLEDHNRHVSALSVLILLALGGSSMEEVTDLAVAGRVHDMCLREIPEVFYTRHLNGQDLGTIGARRLYVDHMSSVYRGHIEMALGKLQAMPVPVRPGVLKIVEQHHENHDGTGLYGIPGAKMYRLAKIIRIADDLITLINCETDSHTMDQAFKKLDALNSAQSTKVYDPIFMRLISAKLMS